MYMEILVLFMSAALMTCSEQTIDRARAAEYTAKARRLPGLDVCGTSGVPLGSRIVNGEPAKLGAYPWMASLGYVLGKSPTLLWGCGASLITDQFVITAAHCVDPAVIAASRPYRLQKVRLGDLDLDDTVEDGASPTDFDIQKVIRHRHYNSNRKINDIALIKLNGAVEFSAFIKPICLPLPEYSQDMYYGYRPIVAGWGRTTYNSTDVNGDTRLMEADVEIQDTDSCRTNMTSVIRNATIDDRVICASSHPKDTCKGDSGGPLMFFDIPTYSATNSSGNMYLMGIVSYGWSCAKPGYPGVYLRAAKYMDWIVDKLDI